MTGIQRILDEESIVPPALSFIIALVIMRKFLTTPKDIKTIGVLAFTAYLIIPLITHRLTVLHNHRLQEIFAYVSILPGTLIILHPGLATVETIYSLFILSHTGYWFWAGWLYASKATDLYTRGHNELLLGNGFVPVFTVIPVAIILLLASTVSRTPWLEQAGLFLYAAAVVTIYLVLRAS